MRLIIFMAIIFVVSISCTRFNKRQQEPLAKVYNNYLYREDLANVLPPGMSADDSIRLVRNFIDKWIRNQLFLRLAENNLPEKEKNLDKQISEFRASILVYKYQQHLLNQKLDSVINLNEIEEYYASNSINFILEKPAIRGIYMKVPVDAPNRANLLAWFRNDADLIQIENYRNQFARNYSWFNESWIYLDDILSEIPAGLLNTPSNISNLDHIMISDSEYHYFIGILEYKAARGQMPFSLASQKIKSIILNKRKIQFLKELENNVFTEGLTKNAYQYY
jgi:hypothetical protein